MPNLQTNETSLHTTNHPHSHVVAKSDLTLSASTRSGDSTPREEVLFVDGRFCHLGAVGPFEPTLNDFAAVAPNNSTCASIIDLPRGSLRRGHGIASGSVQNPFGRLTNDHLRY